jgi:hypothetical protein
MLGQWTPDCPAQDYLSYRHSCDWIWYWSYATSVGLEILSLGLTLSCFKARDDSTSFKGCQERVQRMEDNDEQRLLDGFGCSVDVVRLDQPLVSFRARAAYCASCLESHDA